MMRPFNVGAAGGAGFTIPKKPKLEDKDNSRWSSSTTKSNKFSETAASSSSAASSSRQAPAPRTVEDTGYVVWTGSLHYGDQHVESIDLKSPHRSATKPSGFSSSMQVHRLVHWKDCVKYQPIAELIAANKSQLHQKPFLLLRTDQQQVEEEEAGSNGTAKEMVVQVSYFYLINTFSPLFARLCKEMKEAERAAFGVLDNGTFLALIPDGALSAQLAFPRYEGPGCILHALFILAEPDLAEPMGQAFTFDTIPRIPAAGEKLDGADPNLRAALEQYRRESRLPVVQRVAPKHVDSLFTPSQRPPGGKVPTPYIPTPGIGLGHGQHPPRPVYQQQKKQPYNQLTTPLSSSSSSGSAGTSGPAGASSEPVNDALHSILYGPPPPPPPSPPPPPPPPEEEPKEKPTPAFPGGNGNILEQRQKNKAFFVNAFAAIRNIGGTVKTTEALEPAETGSSGSSSTLESNESKAALKSPPSVPEELIKKDRVIPIPLNTSFITRDPRLARHLAQQQQAQMASSMATMTVTKPSTMTTTTNGSGGSAISSKFPPLPVVPAVSKDDVKEPAASQGRPISEALHESAEMEIDDDEEGKEEERPYSPSQARYSPEPMELDVDEKEEKAIGKKPAGGEEAIGQTATSHSKSNVPPPPSTTFK